MKYRFFREHNYKAFYINDRIIHVPFDPSKEIEDIIYPEHYIIRLDDAKDPVLKIQSFFGDMGDNELPFSIFIDGDEPTEHDQFVPCMKEFYRYGIDTGFSTSGLFINQNERDLKKFKTSIFRFCNNVTVKYDPEIAETWSTSIHVFMDSDLKVNLEFNINSFSSVQEFLDGWNEWNGKVEKFILCVDDIEELEHFSESISDKMDSVVFKEQLNPTYSKVLDLTDMKIKTI